MAEAIRFLAPLPPVALRRNRETRSHNWRAALIREYQEAVWIAGADHRGDDPYCWWAARLRLTWRHHRQGPDHDNALASCKPLIDVLHCQSKRSLGLVWDDGPEHLAVELRTEKVQRKQDEGVLVEIERVDVIEEALCGER